MWRGNTARARSVADPQVLSGSIVPNCKWEGHWEKTVVWEGVRSEGLFCGNTVEISGGNTPALFLGPSFIFSINCTRYMIVAAKKVRPITVCGALLRLKKCKHAAWAESVRTNPPGLGDVWAGYRAHPAAVWATPAQRLTGAMVGSAESSAGSSPRERLESCVKVQIWAPEGLLLHR